MSSRNSFLNGDIDEPGLSSTPVLPGVGKYRVYLKSDGNLYVLDHAGKESRLYDNDEVFLLTSNVDTNTSLGTSDTKVPSQNAVRTYVLAHSGGASTASDISTNQTGKTVQDELDSLNLDSEAVYAFYTADGSTSQSIPNGAETIRDWPTKVFDTHNAVTTGASWMFTVPKDGVYTFNVITQVDGGHDYGAWEMWVDGTETLEAWWAGYTGFGMPHQSNFTYRLTAGQYVQFKIFHNSASGTAGNSIIRNSIAICKISK